MAKNKIYGQNLRIAFLNKIPYDWIMIYDLRFKIFYLLFVTCYSARRRADDVQQGLQSQDAGF